MRSLLLKQIKYIAVIVHLGISRLTINQSKQLKSSRDKIISIVDQIKKCISNYFDIQVFAFTRKWPTLISMCYILYTQARYFYCEIKSKQNTMQKTIISCNWLTFLTTFWHVILILIGYSKWKKKDIGELIENESTYSPEIIPDKRGSGSSQRNITWQVTTCTPVTSRVLFDREEDLREKDSSVFCVGDFIWQDIMMRTDPW